jgi:hypothetical protein
MRLATAVRWYSRGEVLQGEGYNTAIQRRKERWPVATKLTILVPEEVRRRAKARAALEGTTVSEVLRKRLEAYAAKLEAVQAAEEVEEEEDVRAVLEAEAAIAAGEKLIPWEDVEKELDALPD